MLHLLLWMGSTSLSPVQTTVEDMEIAFLEYVSVIWDTQVRAGTERNKDEDYIFMFYTK